jgi:hypothetical protein
MAKPTTTQAADMAMPSPPKKTSRLGSPAKTIDETTAMGTHLATPPKTGKVGLNTEVTAEFRAELKVWAAQNGMKMGEALQKGFELLKAKHR